LEDRSDFRKFERVGWLEVAEAYHQGFAELTTQATGPLLDAVETTVGTRLLDIATGPGYVASAAAKRGALAFGIDFSGPMIAQARRHYPAIPFLVGDAEDLPFVSGRFDAAVLSFGLLHLARPERALRETHRVLRSRGRVAFSVWATPEQAVGFHLVLAAIREHGSEEGVLPPGPAFFRFSQPEECLRTLQEAGFSETRVVQVPQQWRLCDPDDLFQIMIRGTVRTGGLLRAQSADALRSIREAIRRGVEPYRNGKVFELPMPAVLASAVRP
jgi:ubiquinone/menaquinone biosynthesis C-methylase UbiE